MGTTKYNNNKLNYEERHSYYKKHKPNFTWESCAHTFKPWYSPKHDKHQDPKIPSKHASIGKVKKILQKFFFNEATGEKFQREDMPISHGNQQGEVGKNKDLSLGKNIKLPN